MCRPTPTPSIFRKRSSSLSSTDDESCSSSSRSTSSTGSIKRVSFHETVTVYPFEKLGNELRGDIFYCPADYRRFRSDICLETLDQQVASPRLGLGLLFGRLLAPLGRKRAAPKTPKAPPAHHYPWMVSYIPQENEQAEPVPPPPAAAASYRAAEKTAELSRERMLIRELSFAF
jgi:hypothetical protein